MASSRSNKDSRPADPSMGEAMGAYVYDLLHKPKAKTAEDLVDEDSIGGKIKKAKDARKAQIDSALSE